MDQHRISTRVSRCGLAAALIAASTLAFAPTGAHAQDEGTAPAVTATATTTTSSGGTVETTATITPPPDSGLAERLRARQQIADVHRAFGIATWASMAVTAVLGWIQFADEYGFHGQQGETACANGDAVFQDFCTGIPWAHAIAGFTTATLYFTTAGLSLAMESPIERSPDVDLHATLRWIHLPMMLAVATFGIITANIDTDFQTRQALAVTHQGLAVATFGVLTAAAAIVIF
jgi:hypothetical protein